MNFIVVIGVFQHKHISLMGCGLRLYILNQRQKMDEETEETEICETCGEEIGTNPHCSDCKTYAESGSLD